MPDPNYRQAVRMLRAYHAYLFQHKPLPTTYGRNLEAFRRTWVNLILTTDLYEKYGLTCTIEDMVLQVELF